MSFANIVDLFFSLGLFINAGLFIPQAIKLYRTKNTQGLSLLTFGGFNLIQSFAVLHGVINHDWILTLGFSLSLISCGMVTILLIWYKIKPNNRKIA
jgi:MtN3 and saliva related transmembrane protein